MSTAADVSPTGQAQSGGLALDSLTSKPLFNSWTENKKIKTCKCTVCDGRVRASSQKCDGCGRHVCSDCLDPHSNKDQYYKAAARNRIEVGCWACNWRSNMNPAFANRKPAPEVRTEEEHRARASKALGARRKATVEVSRSKRTATESAGAADDLFVPPEDDEPEADHRENKAGQSFTPAARVTSQRTDLKRKRHSEEGSNTNFHQADDNVKLASEVVAQLEQWITTNPFNNKSTTHTSSSTDMEKIRSPSFSSLTPVDDTPADFADGSHLKGASSVIVGCGVVGLFTALELADKLQERGIKHDVTVVEIRENQCELASGACTGIVGTGMPDLWDQQLATKACPGWELCTTNRDFTRDVYLGKNVVISSGDDGVAHQSLKLPSWYHGKDGSLENCKGGWHRVDPEALGSWLYRECMRLGVKFIFGHQVTSYEMANHLFLTNIYIAKANDRSARKKLACNNLILAAGPFTTGIYNSLFKNSAVKLENNVQGVHGFKVRLEKKEDSDKTVLRLHDAAKDNERLENEVRMARFPLDSSLAVSAVSKTTSTRDFTPDDALSPSVGKSSDLRDIAAKYLNHDGMDVADTKKHRQKFRFEICTANGNNPIIDKVPASALGYVIFGDEDLCPFGVWLCYGFGHHGTTLAPGAARLLVSRIFYGEEGDSNYDFSLPMYEKPEPDYEGNGKEAA